MPERKHHRKNLGNLWQKEKKKKKNRGKGDKTIFVLILLVTQTQGSHRYLLPQLRQQVISITSPVAPRLIETGLYGLGKAASVCPIKR